jgi:hypothetical protein
MINDNRPSSHLPKVPTRNNKVIPRTFQTALVYCWKDSTVITMVMFWWLKSGGLIAPVCNRPMRTKVTETDLSNDYLRMSHFITLFMHICTLQPETKRELAAPFSKWRCVESMRNCVIYSPLSTGCYNSADVWYCTWCTTSGPRGSIPHSISHEQVHVL